MYRLCTLVAVAHAAAWSDADFATLPDDESLSLLQLRAQRTDNDVEAKLSAGEQLVRQYAEEAQGPRRRGKGGMGKMGMGKMGKMGMGKMGKMGMGKMGMGMGGGQDEAAAVGDPHLSMNTGAKSDLCCKGGDCQPCELSLLSTKEDKGHALQRRATPDGATNIEFVDRGAGPFAEDGVLTSVRFYSQAAGNKGLRFRIYRPSGGGFSLVGQTEAIAIPGAGAIQEVSFSEPVEYLAGDYVGWSHDGNGNIPFDGNGGRVSWEYNKNNAIGVARGFGSGGARTYSYTVHCEPINDEAEAVADPHMTTNTGKHFDME